MTRTIHIAGTDVQFNCERGQSVLDAALKAGIELPYSCRKGVCGNCAAGIAEGSVAGLNDAPVRNEWCLPDQVLLCMCEATTDLSIAATSWKRVDPAARKIFTARVFDNQLAAPDVSVLRLRLPAGRRAKFQAGQYLQVFLPDGSTRSYSMANPPQQSDGVTLHVRHVQGGQFTGIVTGLQRGDTLRIELPYGNVALAPDDTRPIVFVAGGTGFAPVKSILDDMAKRRVKRDITLIWGAREASGLYLESAVTKWRKSWPDMRYVPAISDADAQVRPGAFAGRVDEALRATVPDLSGRVLYGCGSPAMVQGVRAIALEGGLAPTDFHADVFVPGPTAPGAP